MFKGYYNLTSGMISQGRRLDVVANNMTNVGTSGYRSDRYTDSTFQEVVMSRIGNQDKSGATEIGETSYILAPDQVYTNFEQGPLEDTGLPFDFAIEGDGFFAIQAEDGTTAYTRAGNFSLDNEGYLSLPWQGRVLDISGEPLLIMTDNIQVNGAGSISNGQGTFLGQVGVYAFEDNGALERNAKGLFTGGEAAPAQDAVIHWRKIERSNVELMQQMVTMMSSQRALQSAAQVSKIYDQVMTKATTEIGRM